MLDEMLDALDYSNFNIHGIFKDFRDLGRLLRIFCKIFEDLTHFYIVQEFSEDILRIFIIS